MQMGGSVQLWRSHLRMRVHTPRLCLPSLIVPLHKCASGVVWLRISPATFTMGPGAAISIAPPDPCERHQ